MPRSKYLNLTTISDPFNTVKALRIPGDGSAVTLVDVDLVTIRDEDGDTHIFSDCRTHWGDHGTQYASFTLFQLELSPACSGGYAVYGTDLLSLLPLNEYLIHRPPGMYGDVFVLRMSEGWIGDVPGEWLSEEGVLAEALRQIVSG